MKNNETELQPRAPSCFRIKVVLIVLAVATVGAESSFCALFYSGYTLSLDRSGVHLSVRPNESTASRNGYQVTVTSVSGTRQRVRIAAVAERISDNAFEFEHPLAAVHILAFDSHRQLLDETSHIIALDPAFQIEESALCYFEVETAVPNATTHVSIGFGGITTHAVPLP